MAGSERAGWMVMRDDDKGWHAGVLISYDFINFVMTDSLVNLVQL